jgi:sugar phosphate isomerase/epimerase
LKLAISNIAWRPAEDAAVAALLNELGVAAIEVAPTVVWPRPLEVSVTEATAYRSWWEHRGIQIVALQSLLFGRPDLTVFGAAPLRAATLDYLRGISRLANWLGAVPLVFGSPGNRKAGELPLPERERMALEFFRSAGGASLEAGTVLCLEPNPREYGCDFVNTVEEARALVDAVGSGGFQLHLDAGAMTLAGDSPATVASGRPPRHYHISEPYLRPIGSNGVDHASFGAALRRIDYRGWCSIEMRAPAEGPTLEELRRALRFAAESYGVGVQ